MNNQEPVESIAGIVIGVLILAILSIILYVATPNGQEQYENHLDQIEGGQE